MDNDNVKFPVGSKARCKSRYQGMTVEVITVFDPVEPGDESEYRQVNLGDLSKGGLSITMHISNLEEVPDRQGEEMNTLNHEIKKGNATHVQEMGESERVLYRANDGQPQCLALFRVGCGLKNPPMVDDWYRQTPDWRDVCHIPVNHAMWPAVAVESETQKPKRPKEQFLAGWEDYVNQFTLLGHSAASSETWQEIKKMREGMRALAHKVAGEVYGAQLPAGRIQERGKA